MRLRGPGRRALPYRIPYWGPRKGRSDLADQCSCGDMGAALRTSLDQLAVSAASSLAHSFHLDAG